MFVKKGNGVVSTQMWEGEVHTCNLPAQDVPLSGGTRMCWLSQLPKMLCQHSEPSTGRVPEHQDHGHFLRGLEWQNPFWKQQQAALSCTGSTAGIGMRNSIFKRSDLCCSFGVFLFHQIKTTFPLKIK